jgi:hypothetical protein
MNANSLRKSGKNISLNWINNEEIGNTSSLGKVNQMPNLQNSQTNA